MTVDGPEPMPQRVDPQAWARMLAAIRVVEPGSRRSELHRLGDAMRSIVHRVVRTGAPAEVVATLADAVEAVGAELRSHPVVTEYEGFAESANAGGAAGFFDRSPMLGTINPLAPPLLLREEDGKIVGTATFGAAYEGPPSCVHGGYVAAAFDELLGSVQSLSGAPGMTGHLAISYRSPTPLEQELRLEGVIDSVSGRKIRCSGSIWVGDRLCATAEALFITIDPTRFGELREQRAKQVAADDVD